MRTTAYFEFRRSSPDRRDITDEMILWAIQNSTRIEVQKDGRIKLWAKIEHPIDRYLRVILLPDGETVHNAFFDRSYRE